MYQHNLPCGFRTIQREAHQPLLIRMTRVARQGYDFCAHLIHPPIQINLHKPFRPFTRLYHRARRALGLVTDKHYLVPRIPEHGLEVIDDAPPEHMPLPAITIAGRPVLFR